MRHELCWGNYTLHFGYLISLITVFDQVKPSQVK